MGDRVFDTFYAATVQSADDGILTHDAMQRSGAALLGKIGMPVILHQGGPCSRRSLPMPGPSLPKPLFS